MTNVMLSVFIIAYNEENAIERCLKSVRWADEIIVVDSGSQDKTMEISRRYTDKVFYKQFTDYAEQKNYALSLTEGLWCLSVDADEEVTLELRKEMEGRISDAETSENAFRLPRRSFIFGRAFLATGTQDDAPIRLFRRGAASFVQPIHEEMHVNGKVGRFKAALNHYTYPTVNGYMTRFNRYTSMEADFIKQKGMSVTGWDLRVKPLAMVAKLYLWKRGFCDGLPGFLFSVLSGFYVFVKYAKRAEKDL